MATNAELEAGIIFDVPPSRELNDDRIVRMAMVALNGADHFRNMQLVIEGMRAADARALARRVIELCAEAGLIVAPEVNRALDEQLEAISE